MFAKNTKKKLANKGIAAVVVEITAGNSARSMSEVIIKGSSNRKKSFQLFNKLFFTLSCGKMNEAKMPRTKRAQKVLSGKL